MISNKVRKYGHAAKTLDILEIVSEFGVLPKFFLSAQWYCCQVRTGAETTTVSGVSKTSRLSHSLPLPGPYILFRNSFVLDTPVILSILDSAAVSRST